MPYGGKAKTMPNHKLYNRAYDLYKASKALVEHVRNKYKDEDFKDDPDNFTCPYMSRLNEILKDIEN